MKPDAEKSRSELLAELVSLRGRVTELEGPDQAGPGTRTGASRPSTDVFAQTTELIRTLSTQGKAQDILRRLINQMRDWSGCDSVGIRFREGLDYPYFETRGFSEEFVQMENRLCITGSDGRPVLDKNGNPRLECMCGNVIQGRTNPDLPFFSGRGSFWSNGTTALLAGSTEADRQSSTRNRCNGVGYESVALVPLRSGEKTYGLLQFNDHREGRFTPELIAFLEFMAESVAMALSRLEADESLRESALKFHQLFNAAPVSLCLVNSAGAILDCNDRFRQMFGQAPEDIANLQQWGAMACPDPDSRQRMMAAWDQAVGQSAGRLPPGAPMACAITDRTGQARIVEISGASLDERFLAVIPDVTESKRVEEALRQAKEQAEASTCAKSEFLANMSHEIRTPLNGILGMLQVIAMSSPTPEQAECVSAAMQSGQRLTRLLTDILDLSRIEAGKIEIVESEFSPLALLRGMVDVFLAVSMEKNMPLRAALDSATPETLIGDELRLTQILTNLLGNAFKHTDQGEVTLGLAVFPGQTPSRCRLVLTVSDTGQGIPEDKIATIFESFKQIDGSITRTRQGAGLGLSIVQRLVELMHGDITVTSTVGQGTTFRCSVECGLPVAESDSPDTTPVMERPFANLSRRILVVEDDETSAMAIKRLLEKAGHVAVIAKEGKACLDLLSSRPFNLILMDIQMPVMGGVGATREIRNPDRFGPRSSIPIIALTAHAMRGDKERFLEAGMDGYVSKPVDLTELNTVMERVLASKEKTSGL